MSVITKDLGVATAYGYAKSKGYTGTEEEFAELMASYADVAQQAEAAAQDAEDAKDAAVSAKNDAQTAQTAAESAQAAAAGSAQTASTKATEASNSAQTAAGSATAAGNSATAAAGSAQTAQTAAQTATNKASEASSSATAANTAKTDAQTARTGAQTAQAAAETAQANAEAAASSVSASAAQIEQNTEDIAELKNDLIDNYVSKKGERQVTPQNIEGMQYTKTTGEVEGENIFTSDMLFAEGKYVVVADGGIVGQGSSASYNAYCIPVEQNTKYKFTTSRFVVLATGNTINSPAIGTTMSYLSEVETGSATYMFLSIDVDFISNIYVKPVTVDVVYSDFILPDWLVDNLPIPTEKPKFATVAGNISSGENLQLTATRTNLRKGEQIVFEGNISSFESIRIGLSFSTAVGTDGNQMNTFRIDGTNISYYARSDSTPVTVAHGLTLANNIQIIWEMSAEASVKFTLISNGNMFTNIFSNFERQTIGKPFVLSVGTTLTECKLTWTCIDLCKDIWMFGDSYFSYSESRWPYYLHQYGYDKNCLLDGFAGEGGVNGRSSFNNLLQFGTPKFAVWCLGMNDTSDSDSAPATDWVTNRDYFLQYCQNNNVIPMFGTIPTVPSINHEQKNAWIRSSGYRYIDFAKAVGASSSGVWFDGMLSSDNVHPTKQGARALFARVLLDLPEIMVDNFDY